MLPTASPFKARRRTASSASPAACPRPSSGRAAVAARRSRGIAGRTIGRPHQPQVKRSVNTSELRNHSKGIGWSVVFSRVKPGTFAKIDDRAAGLNEDLLDPLNIKVRGAAVAQRVERQSASIQPDPHAARRFGVRLKNASHHLRPSAEHARGAKSTQQFGHRCVC